MKFTSTCACQCGDSMIFGLLWKISSEVGAPSTVLAPGSQTDDSRSLLSAKSTFPFSGNSRFLWLTLMRLAANANEQMNGRNFMRTKLACAALALALTSGPAFAVSGDLTIWSWNIAASSLKATVAGFNKQFPDVKVTVQDLGNQPTYDKSIAGCAAGGEGLPDIVSIENGEAENYWSQFPDCFVDLHTLGYSAEDQKKFPDFKRTELEVGDKAYAMPWDSGPVAAFYRRDFYEKAGVDPASIKTWDDFIAAGKKIQAANPGVSMTNADFNGDTEFLRMISNEQGCGYFASDGQSITVNQPKCVDTLTKI